MSGNSGNRSDQENAADRIVREILSNQVSVESISPTGELLRVINRYNRNRPTSHPASNSSPTENTAAPETGLVERMSGYPYGVRERYRRARAAASAMSAAATTGYPIYAVPSVAAYNADPRRPPIANGTIDPRPPRPRTNVNERYIDRSSALGIAMDSSASVMYQAGEQLGNENSHLRALLDTPISNFTQPSLLAQEYAGEAEANRAFKRRKLDAGISDPEFAGVSYGHYGQVEPGKLNMEIDFCDGGMYSEDNGSNYGAANVLKNDSSVYCTKGNRCNLVLRHQGGTAFCLKELIIKAPPRGYTAPVQEGMVFVSMSSDDLLTRTAQYQIQYSPPRPPRRRGHQSNHSPRPPILSIRHLDGTITASTDSRRPIYAEPENEDATRLAQIPSEFTTSPPFHVTSTCSSDSESDPPPTSLLRRRRRNRSPNGHPRAFTTRISASSSPEADPQDATSPASYSSDEFPRHAWAEDSEFGDAPAYLPSTRRSEPGQISIELSEAIDAAQEATQEAVKSVGGNLMAPHAHFFIKRDKSRCTVRFEPPVSGRFILLKMWSPHHTADGNIDIQSVVVKGFAGTRYFPSVQVR